MDSSEVKFSHKGLGFALALLGGKLDAIEFDLLWSLSADCGQMSVQVRGVTRDPRCLMVGLSR